MIYIDHHDVINHCEKLRKIINERCWVNKHCFLVEQNDLSNFVFALMRTFYRNQTVVRLDIDEAVCCERSDELVY